MRPLRILAKLQLCWNLWHCHKFQKHEEESAVFPHKGWHSISPYQFVDSGLNTFDCLLQKNLKKVLKTNRCFDIIQT